MLAHIKRSDRIKGMFAGAFLGDALGAPHEFKCNSKIIYTGKLEFEPFLNTRYQGTKRLAVGQVTDDSEMTLTLLRYLVANGKYNKTDVTMSYMTWANSPNLWMLGRNTRSLFKGIKTYKGYTNRMNKQITSGTCETNQSNGAMMRCSPLALLDDTEAIKQDCYITNFNQVTNTTNQIYIIALKLALQGHEAKFILSYIYDLIDNYMNPEVKQVIYQVSNQIDRDVKVNKGWCLHALWITLTAIDKFDNYTDAMHWIIHDKRGDTDTNACIAGALFGAIYGYNKLYSEQKENIDIMLNCDTSLYTFRPKEYTLYDFHDLMLKVDATF